MTDTAIPFAPGRPCPLDGVRVLDLSRLVCGNMLTLQLADFGAEVIKLEPPEGDPLRHWREAGVSVYWKVYGRNKKSVRLDLRTDEGKALLRRLLPTAHVLVESFRPGVMETAGFGPDQMLALNSKLVIVRVSGFGQTGPYSPRPGFGSLAEAMCGFAAKNGFADKPPALPNMALADMVAGIQGAFATMVALREAEREGGCGQVVDLSLLEPLHMTLGPDAAVYRLTGRSPLRSGNRVSLTAPRNVYATVDDAWLALCASTQGMTARLFRSLDRPEPIEDPRFRTNADRLRHVEELDAIVQDFVGQRTLASNIAFFCSGPGHGRSGVRRGRLRRRSACPGPWRAGRDGGRRAWQRANARGLPPLFPYARSTSSPRSRLGSARRGGSDCRATIKTVSQRQSATHPLVEYL